MKRNQSGNAKDARNEQSTVSSRQDDSNPQDSVEPADNHDTEVVETSQKCVVETSDPCRRNVCRSMVCRRNVCRRNVRTPSTAYRSRIGDHSNTQRSGLYWRAQREGVVNVDRVQLDDCIVCYNTVFGSNRSATMHKLFTSCIRQCLVPRACDWVMPALPGKLLIFRFQFSLLFFHVRHPCSTAANVVYIVSAIVRCQNLVTYLSCTECTTQSRPNDFEWF